MADLNLSAHLGELAQGLDQHSVESEFRSANDASSGPTAGIGHPFLSDNLSLFLHCVQTETGVLYG